MMAVQLDGETQRLLFMVKCNILKRMGWDVSCKLTH